jgi:hypothetical protein
MYRDEWASSKSSVFFKQQQINIQTEKKDLVSPNYFEGLKFISYMFMRITIFLQDNSVNSEERAK